MEKNSKKNKKYNLACENFLKGREMVKNNDVFSSLLYETSISNGENSKYFIPEDALCINENLGYIVVNDKKMAEPEEWARAIAHCLLHLGMGHITNKENHDLWNIACDLVVEKFLDDLKFGKRNENLQLPLEITTEEQLYKKFILDGVDEKYLGFGTAGIKTSDISYDENIKKSGYYAKYYSVDFWTSLFSKSLSKAVENAVRVVGGELENIDGGNTLMTKSQIAKRWFISSYPLFGALATNFKIIEDLEVCRRMDIKIAAVSPYLQEIYINPLSNLTLEELKFVMAHEYLHVALCHEERKEWRDSYLWNVACDYLINIWLTDMEIGHRPEGLLYDVQFRNLGAEAIYDRIVTDLRLYRKLATLRGEGLGDIIEGNENWWTRGDGVDLDAFYRRAIGQGLQYHQEQGRGYIPQGLIEEIRALSHPPIPWDVELGRWFDENFAPLEKIRTYARPSRRQGSTPDIPRASYKINEEKMSGRTFGVVLDTSGSMDRSLLAVCLGAIASFSVARDVTGVRVIFCDAEAYDEGYMTPEEIAGRVKVKGRGGTILQPGIDILLNATDFPKDAPILVITDGYCENNLIFKNRTHGFLIPKGNKLPFVPNGKVFRIN